MTPIADVERLAQGELYFPPELNGTNRKPDALDTLIAWVGWYSLALYDLSGKSDYDAESLWALIALSLYLEPSAVDPDGLLEAASRSHGQVTVATLFRDRLQLALSHLPSGNLPSISAVNGEKAEVRFEDFIAWARVYGIALPSCFPGVDGWMSVVVAMAEAEDALLDEDWGDKSDGAQACGPSIDDPVSPESPVRAAVGDVKAKSLSRARTRAERSTSTPLDGFLRLPEVLERVAFSRATLYRMIKDGTFPDRVMLSTGIAAWPMAAVQAWIAEISAPGFKKPRKTKTQTGANRC